MPLGVYDIGVWSRKSENSDYQMPIQCILVGDMYMKAMKYNQKALNDVDGSIKAAIASFGKTKNLVQVAAVAILIHAEKCGDYSKANTLIEGLVGLNQAALVEFFVQFGGLTVSEGAKKFDGWNGKSAVKVEEGKGVMWYDLKKQNPWAGFNLKAEMLKLVKKADNAIEKAEGAPEYESIVHIDSLVLGELRRLSA